MEIGGSFPSSPLLASILNWKGGIYLIRPFMFILVKRMERWLSGCCSCRGPELYSQHPYGILDIFLSSMGTKHTHGNMHTYIQVKHSDTKLVF